MVMLLAAVIGGVVRHERFGWARIVAAGFGTLGIVVPWLA
jgi:drug/metabolite transporter (DMT)-like permease